MALLARGRAGVVGAAVERRLQAEAGGQPRDHPGGAAGRGDVARLVDVQLHQAVQLVQPGRRLAQPVGVHAGVGHGVAERHAVLVHAGQRVVDVQAADQRARPEGRRVEPRALLVGERDDRHGDGGAGATAKPAATPSAPS